MRPLRTTLRRCRIVISVIGDTFFDSLSIVCQEPTLLSNVQFILGIRSKSHRIERMVFGDPTNMGNLCNCVSLEAEGRAYCSRRACSGGRITGAIGAAGHPRGDGHGTETLVSIENGTGKTTRTGWEGSRSPCGLHTTPAWNVPGSPAIAPHL